MNFDDLELKDSRGRHVVPDDDVVDAARVISAGFYAYCREMAEAAGSQYPRPSDKYAAHFYQAAELCIELGLSPEEYLQIQLDHMGSNGSFWPNGIANRTPFEEQRNSREMRSLAAVRRFAAQLDLYDARVRLYGPAMTLRDTTNDFTPLFRCVMANKNGIQDLVKHYAASAIVELDATPAAREVFREELDFLDDWRAAYSGL